MAAIKSLTEDEKALVQILQSNIDLPEFLWKSKDGITPYRVYDYQYAFNDNDGQNIFADARSVGKSEMLARKSCSFIFRKLGADKLVTAPQMVHLKPDLENIIARIYSSRLLKEMVKGHPSRQPDYLIRFQTGGSIRGRIPGITGIGVKGLHVAELDVDEAQDYPESGWENLRECLDMGGQFTVFGVHNGIRNTFYHLSNDSDWKAKIITKMHMLDWGEKERESRLRFYGSSKAPAYIRNVYAIAGDAEYPMFRYSKFMEAVDQGKKQKDGTYNKFQPTWSSDYYFVRLIAEELGPHHISHYLRFPQLHKKYKVCWLGVDWGHNVDPGEFLIFAEAEVNGKRVLKLIARIHTERLKDTDGNQSQKEIVKEIFSFYNLVGIAADSTGRGGGICQTLMSEKDIKTLFDGFAFNGSLVIGKDEKTKKDIKEPFKRYSGELLQLMVENGEIALPYDDEIVSDWLAHKERPTKAGKEFTADKSADDHTLDAARVAVTQREARRLRHRRRSSERIPFGRWVGQTGGGSVPGAVC